MSHSMFEQRDVTVTEPIHFDILKDILLTHMTRLLVQVSRDGTILKTIPTGECFVKENPTDLPGKNICDLLPIAGPERILDALNQACEQNAPTSLMAASGVERPLWLNFLIAPTPDGKLLISIKDVTEKELSKARYNELVKHANCLILHLDLEGRIVFVNDFALQLFGYTSEELIGRPATATVVPARDSDGRNLSDLILQIVRNPGAFGQNENENTTKDGQRIIIRWTNQPLYENGEYVGLLCMGDDITEIRTSQQELRKKERYFKALIQNSYDLISVLDAQGKVMYESPSACARFGLKPEQVLGKPLSTWVHPQDVATFQTFFNNTIRGENQGHGLELRRLHHSGRWITLEIIATNLLTDPAVAGVIINSRDIEERKHHENELRRRVLYDELTGLPNRTLFIDRLRHAIMRRQRKPEYNFALIFIDLDRFKLINDSLGHHIGDALLKKIGNMLTNQFRKVDSVARLGSDEFVLLLDDFVNDRVAVHMAERIQQALSEPFHIKGHEIYTSAGLGIVFGSNDYDEAENLIRDAETAAHQAKLSGCGQYTIFHSGMHSIVSEQLSLETDLRKAIAAQEFILHYQPIYDLSSERICGLEALIRWQHPTRGLIFPDAFIPLAEDTGLIVPIGEIVIQQAFNALLTMDRELPPEMRPALSVNLSAKQFAEPALLQNITSLLQKTGLAPRRLTFEITESAILADPDQARELIASIKNLGIGMAIDDFGTGYSSLSYLQRLHFDTLKIDKSFIMDLSHDSRSNLDIIKTIITLASALNLEVVAEGIETQYHRDLMHQMGCQYGQGYFFHRPMSLDQLIEITKLQAD